MRIEKGFASIDEAVVYWEDHIKDFGQSVKFEKDNDGKWMVMGDEQS